MYLAQTVASPGAVVIVVSLMALCIFIVGSALAHSAKWIFDSIFHGLFLILHALPLHIGRRPAKYLEGVGNKASDVLGHWAAQSDAKVGKYFWRLYHTFAGVLELLAALEIFAWYMQYYVLVKYPLARLHSALAHVGKSVTIVEKKYTTVTRQAKLTKAQMAAIVASVLAGVKIAKHTAAHAAGAVALPLPRIGRLEREAHAVKARLGKLERRFGRRAFAAAVATALATLGVSWARRSCARRTANNFCKVDTGLLGSIVGDTLIAAGLISIVEFAEVMQEVTPTVTWVVKHGIREAGNKWPDIPTPDTSILSDAYDEALAFALR